MELVLIIIVFLIGVIVGVCLFGLVLWYILSFFLMNPDQSGNSTIQQPQQQAASSTFQLPPALQSKINDESFKAKENCWAFNFILYFLFRELRNSEPIRRWLLRKLAMEFDESLATSMMGRVFSNITIQSIDMGQNFPVINWLKTTKVELHPVSNCISTLDILVDLTYSGGFTFAIQAETHIKNSAYLSVKIKEVKGKARVQFTTEPYAHWSISFAETPDIDIDVASQLYGKSFSHVTSIIATHLKRSVRKKHTLPMFKIRYKPFFVRMEHAISALLPQTAPQVETSGKLSMTVVECRGLLKNLIRDSVYATVGIGNLDWVCVFPSPTDPKNAYLILDVICVKTLRREANLDFALIQIGSVPVVESYPLISSVSITQAVLGTVNGNPYQCPDIGLQIGDEIIAVDGKKVTTIKQCIKNFRGSKSVKVVWRIRRKVILVSASDNDAAVIREEDLPAGTHDNDVPSASGVGEVEQSAIISEPDDDSLDTTSGRFPFLVFETSSSTSDQRPTFVGKTRTLRNTSDPIFEEKFDLDVAESNRFLNVTLWTSVDESDEGSADSTPSGSPAKKNKNPVDKLFPFGKDRVLGCLSVPLMDILSECSTTGMGFFVKDYYLASPDGNASEAREHNMKDYSGFDPHLCYGRITLSFLYKPTDDTSRRKLSLISSSVLHPKPEVEQARAGGSISPTDENQPHQFVRTHFRSAAFCDYCNKKIWLKEAYTCQMCNMKCHKKCYERCVVNTTCRGEIYQAKASLTSGTVTPEIIMTHSEPVPKNVAENLAAEKAEHATTSAQDKPPTATTVRRRTLGGLIVSAVQNRSSQLRRVGSATALVPPVLNPNGASKSLPPSPQASPTFQRRPGASAVEDDDQSSTSSLNPFEILDSGSPSNVEEDLIAAVDQLTRSQTDDFVSIAKETGRDVFKGMLLAERKLRLNDLLNRLQGEIDKASHERMTLEKAEAKAPAGARTVYRNKICACEERVKALAILMLHYCAGLQQVQEEEELEKQAQLIASSVLEDVEDDDEQEENNDDECSVSTGLLSNLSASTACLIELDDD